MSVGGSLAGNHRLSGTCFASTAKRGPGPELHLIIGDPCREYQALPEHSTRNLAITRFFLPSLPMLRISDTKCRLKDFQPSHYFHLPIIFLHMSFAMGKKNVFYLFLICREEFNMIIFNSMEILYPIFLNHLNQFLRARCKAINICNIINLLDLTMKEAPRRFLVLVLKFGWFFLFYFRSYFYPLFCFFHVLLEAFFFYYRWVKSVIFSWIFTKAFSIEIWKF